MSTDTVLTDEQRVSIEGECHLRYANNKEPLVRNAIEITEQAVLQSPEVVAMRRNTLLAVLGRLNSNPYSLTKSECIDIVREMFEEADAAMKEQKP